MSRLLIGIAILLFSNAILFAAPAFHEVRTYYPITGHTAQDLRLQMNQLGPVDHDHHYDAKTSWYVRWKYHWKYDHPSQNPCYVTSVEITEDTTYIFPEWINQNESNTELRSQWQTYLLNLSAHEQGHANNGKQAAIEIENALLQIPPMSNCENLQRALEDKAREIIQQHNEWDVQYDAETNHGKTQGAIFP